MAHSFPLATAIVALLAIAVVPAGAMPPGSPRAMDAFALCELAEKQGDDARVEFLTRGISLAQAAVDADERDALGQFALFCNLGRHIKAVGLNIAVPFETLRALRALDATLALAPDDPDVIAAKGAVLIELPWILGGDTARGEQWLRRALALDPQNVVARWYLVRRLGVDTDASM